ncbi:hypothetical protein RCL1_002248 [Eukaryota sp. TZLM3-RCL]
MKCLLLLLLAFSLFVDAHYRFSNVIGPGLTSTVSRRGVEHITNTVVEIIRSELENTPIDDVEGDADSPLGKIHYHLSEIIVLNPVFSSLSLQPDGHGLRLQVTDVQFSLAARWSYKFGIVSDSGTMDAFSSSYIAVSLDVHPNSEGGVSASLRDPVISIAKLNVRLHKSIVAWIYQFFVDLFNHQVKKTVENVVKDVMITTINDLIKTSLDNVNPVVEIDEHARMDMRLMKTLFKDDYISTSFNGNLLPINSLVRPNLEYKQLPELINNKHIQMFISEYALNSAGFVYHFSDALHKRLYPGDVPANFSLQLNTNSFKWIIPNLYRKYPNMDMVLDVSTLSAPHSRINSTGVTVDLSCVCNISVIIPSDGSIRSVFSLGLTVHTEANAWIEELFLKGKLNLLNFKFAVVSTDIGPFDVFLLNRAVTELVKFGILPFLNNNLQQGIEIPITEGIVLRDPELVFGDGFMVVSSDVDYIPE